MSSGNSSRRLSRAAALLLMAMALPTAMTNAAKAAGNTCANPLANTIPNRVSGAPSGAALMRQLMDVSGTTRDTAIMRQVLAGNVPDFLRGLIPVSIRGKLASGASVLVTLCVTPGYLAVGNDRDFVRVPLGLAAAARIASELGFLLPTTKIVDTIYDQAEFRVAPRPMEPTSQMESTDYLLRHNATLNAQLAGSQYAPDALTAGQKKDVVLTNRMLSKPGRVAIYGWHRTNGKPIQPLSTVHGAGYADYSHGVRLISQLAFINGKPIALADLLRDRELSGLVSSEGPIQDARGMLAHIH